ncbi:transposase [Streptomyces sp. NBC_00012]
MTRLTFLLADPPVELLGRMRSDRVLYFPPPPQPAGKRGRKPKRGAEFAFEVAATQPIPSVTTVTDTTHYWKAVATAWDRLHPLLVRRSAWPTTPKETCRSSKAPSSVFRSTTSVETATPGRSGCGGRPPPRLLGMWTGSGRHSCADSTLTQYR